MLIYFQIINKNIAHVAERWVGSIIVIHHLVELFAIMDIRLLAIAHVMRSWTCNFLKVAACGAAECWIYKNSGWLYVMMEAYLKSALKSWLHIHMNTIN